MKTLNFLKRKLIYLIPIILFSCSDINEIEQPIQGDVEPLKGASIPDPNANKFIGFGYNPLSTQAYYTAFIDNGKNFTRNTDLGSLTTEVEISIISTDQELSEMISTSAKLEISDTEKNVPLDTESNFKTNGTLTSKYFAVVAKINFIKYRYQLVGTPVLTNTAQQKFNTDINSFMNDYGKMYITDQTIGGTCYYIYEFDISHAISTSSADLKDGAKVKINDLMFESTSTIDTQTENDLELSQTTGYAKSDISGFYPMPINENHSLNDEIARIEAYVNDANNIENLVSLETKYASYCDYYPNQTLSNAYSSLANSVKNYTAWNSLFNRINFIVNSTKNSSLKNKATIALSEVSSVLNVAKNGGNISAPDESKYNEIFSLWLNEQASTNIQSLALSSSYSYQVEGNYGQHAQGGGIGLCDINNNGISDIVLLQIDNPSGYNNAYISVGWDLNELGKPQRWSHIQKNDVCHQKENDGGDITITDVDRNGIMDYVIFVIDNPSGYNNGYYLIGYDINSANGQPVRWSDKIKVNIDWNMKDNDGAGIIARDINKNGIPDILISYIDDPSGTNKGYYNIGWDMNTDGTVKSWSSRKVLTQNFWTSNSDCGVTIGDITGDGKDDLISFYIDNTSGTDKAYIAVGATLNEYGNVTGNWTDTYQYVGNFTSETDGAGIAIGNIDNNGGMDLITYHIDDSDKYNSGWCNIKYN